MEPEHGEIIGVHEHGLLAAREAGQLSEGLFPSPPPGSLADVGKSASERCAQQCQCAIRAGRGGD